MRYSVHKSHKLHLGNWYQINIDAAKSQSIDAAKSQSIDLDMSIGLGGGRVVSISVCVSIAFDTIG